MLVAVLVFLAIGCPLLLATVFVSWATIDSIVSHRYDTLDRVLARAMVRVGCRIDKRRAEEWAAELTNIQAESAVGLGYGIEVILGSTRTAVQSVLRLQNGRWSLTAPAETCLATGFHDLDSQLRGLRPTDLIICSAGSGAEKTGFAVGVAMNAALQTNKPVLFFSLERSRLELTHWMLRGEAKVDSDRMRRGDLLSEDWEKIRSAMDRLYSAELYIDDNPSVTTTAILTKARRLKSRLGDLGLIVIDYLEFIVASSDLAASDIGGHLKAVALELECPVLALARGRKMGSLNEGASIEGYGRMPGELDNAADVVISLHREDATQQTGLVKVFLAQRRAGVDKVDRATCHLAFIDSYTHFANLARPPHDQLASRSAKANWRRRLLPSRVV